MAWHIESIPPGAEVYQLSKDELLGKTPLRIEQPIQPGEVQVELRLTGYLPKRITLACDRDQEPPTVKLEQEKPEPVDKGKKGKGKTRRHSKK